MFHLRLPVLLGTIDKKTFGKLGRYILYAIPDSRREKDLPLWHFLADIHPNFHAENCTYQHALSKSSVYKTTKEVSASATRLFKLAENFLITEAALKNEVFKSAALSSFYLSNKLSAHYKPLEQTYDAQSIDPRMQTEEFHLAQFFRLIDEMRFFTEEQAHEYPINRLQVARWSLEQFYQISRLRFDLGHFTRSIATQDWYTDFQSQAKETYSGDGVLVDLYRKVLGVFERRVALELEEAIALLRKDWDAIPTDHLSEIAFALKGYCVALINKGKAEYLDPFLEINMLLDANHLLVTGDRMEISTFRNIIYATVIKGKFDFADRIIDSYQDMLPEESREVLVGISRANLSFARGDFEAASSILATLNPSSFADTFHWRKLSIKAAFELDDHEVLQLHLSSWRRWEKVMKKAAPERLRDMQHFGHYLSQIVKMKVRNEKVYRAQENWEALKKQIETDQTVIERDWLLGICNQFI